MNSNLLEPALADLRQIFIDFPSSAAAAEASFMSAEILERLGRLEEAMAAHIEFNKRFAKDPRLPASKLRLAQLTLQSRQPDRETRARQILGEIATAHPKTSHALAALQMKLKLEQGRGPREMDPVLGIEVPRALPTLRALAEQFPTSPTTMIALNRLAELYLDIERLSSRSAGLHGSCHQLSRQPQRRVVPRRRNLRASVEGCGQGARRLRERARKARRGTRTRSAGSSNYGALI